MKFSLATVARNSAPTIDATLRSVLAQEGIELEYLVADGASTDDTPAIIRRHAAQLAWWVSEPDRGQTDALNKAFTHATGDVLGFLNADDLLLPGALRSIRECFEQHPETDLVYGQIEWIDLEGQAVGSHCGRIGSLEEILDIFAVWWGGRQWVQPEVFFRRSLWERVGPFDLRYHLAFDYDFWVRCFRAGATVRHLPRPLVQFRRHPGQKSAAFEKAVDEIRTICGRHLAGPLALPPAVLRRLRAELSYDLYQAGKSTDPGTPTPAAPSRASFLHALLRHPQWLIVPRVRERLAASLKKSRRMSHAALPPPP